MKTFRITATLKPFGSYGATVKAATKAEAINRVRLECGTKNIKSIKAVEVK
jgi:hypothetical protein